MPAVTRRFWLAPLVALLLSGCATSSEPPASIRAVTVAPGVTVTLPTSPSPGRVLEVTQLVTAHYQDHTFSFEGHVAISPERLLLVGLDTMGRRALTVTWTADGVTVDAASWLPDTLRPGNMLADIVMTYWPEAAIRAALKGASLETTRNGERVIRNADGTEVIRIDYGKPWNGIWSGRFRLRNLAWGYDLDIQSEEAP